MKVKPPNPRTLYLGQIIFDSEILKAETSITQKLTNGILDIKTSGFIPRGLNKMESLFLIFQSIFSPFFCLVQKNS